MDILGLDDIPVNREAFGCRVEDRQTSAKLSVGGSGAQVEFSVRAERHRGYAILVVIHRPDDARVRLPTRAGTPGRFRIVHR